MKKLYTMITILLLSTHVFAADPVVVVPPSPIIPTMTTVTPNEVTSAAEPLTNMVFINESGSTPNINITQTGTNNNLGVSALTPFMFTGDNQIFTSIQTVAPWLLVSYRLHLRVSVWFRSSVSPYFTFDLV